MTLFPSTVAADTMFRANPEHTGVFDNSGIVQTNTELWHFRTGDVLGSSPAVSNGVVYVGSMDHNMYAIDAVMGTEKWRFKTGGYLESSPAISNGVVYVGSMDHNLYAIDAVTGTEKWRFTTGWWVSSSPVVANGVVCIGSTDHNLYAIDAVTGTEKWRFATKGTVDSSPAVSNGVVYVGSTDHNLYAIDAVTGTEKWRFTTEDWGWSSPAVSNGVVYVGSVDNNTYAIDAVTGTEKWRFKTENSVGSSPSVSNGVVYVGSWDNNTYAIDAITGLEKWRFKTGGFVDSSPAVSNGVVYVGSFDTYLYAIDAVTGTEKWRFKTGNSIRSSPALSNGVIYVVSTDNNLYAVGGVSSTPITTLTAGTIPRTQNAPPTISTTPTFPQFNSGDSNLTLPIIIILAVLFIVGGGYGIYRMKKTPLVEQFSDSKRKKVNTPPPQENSLHDSLTSQKNQDLIFISSKSEDFEHTQPLYTFLKDRGYNVFFSQLSLPDMGSCDYRKEIDDALDASKHMIVVTSKKEYVEASWVEAEWGLFINEKRSGRKLGNIITLIIGTMRIEDLPSSLRYYEVIPFDPKTFEKILMYLR